MSNVPRPVEFRPEVAEIRETRCREEILVRRKKFKIGALLCEI